MKARLFALMLAAALTVPGLAGCQTRAAERSMEGAARTVESRAEDLGETVKEGLKEAAQTPSTGSTASASHKVTREDALQIALKHAGLTAEQVTGLHTEYEIEHGVSQYDVEFHHDRWEYDYRIDAETGEVLAFEKDD